MPDRQTARIAKQNNKNEKLERRRQARAARDQYQGERLAVAVELLLHGQEEYVYRAGDTVSNVRIPSTYGEAINDPVYGTKWREAIHNEVQALIRFDTWTAVKRSSIANHNVSTTKWVFTVKTGVDGRIDMFKARLVARGFSQEEGTDFSDTFAPVFRLESLRMLMSIAAQYGLVAHMLDASNAFVGSKLDKPNYIEIPEGVSCYEPEVAQGDYVLALQKSLYGLRQSANLWNKKLVDFLTKIGFKCSTADPSIFINDRGIMVALYVDDILIFGKKEEEIEGIKRKLKGFHPMKDFGLAKKILGIHIIWSKDRTTILLHQQDYVKQILEEFGMTDCKPQHVPIAPSVQLDCDGPQLSPRYHNMFRRIIGRVMFLAVATRPDISYATNRLSQHLASPKEVHLHSAKHVLRYLKSTVMYKLPFRRHGGGLVCYVDSAYANSTESRSTSANVFTLYGNAVSWTSRKQSIVAQSSTEAEYVALADAMKQAIWIRHLLYSVRKPERGGTVLYEDNQGAIKLSGNPTNHSKAKHIKVRYHAIRDAVSCGEVRIEYKSTREMIADTLTKAVGKDTLERLINEVGMRI